MTDQLSWATHKAELRLSQSPSLLISGSGSWPQREGLLSPAARQIYRMNFPPEGFVQSGTVLLMRRQSNPITHYETWLSIFAGCISILFYRPLTQIQSFSGRFIFLHWGTLLRSDFSGSHGAKKHYRLVKFWALALQSFYLFLYVLAYGNLAASPKCLQAELTNITSRHFYSLPVFCIEHSFIYFLLSEFFYVIYLFWHTLTARDDKCTRHYTRQGCK